MHSKIDGPAAYDVLTNFEERWLKASKPQGIKKLKISYDDALLRLERIPDVIGINDTPSGDDDPESWHVQVITYFINIDVLISRSNCFLFYFLEVTISSFFLENEIIESIYYGIQIFRSIDSNSVKGFPKDPREATGKVNKSFLFQFLFFMFNFNSSSINQLVYGR